MAEILSRNIKLNNLQNKLKLINKDILELEIEEKFDVVVTNPPYKKKETGIENENKQKYISKFETTATLKDFTQIANKLLKDKGKFFMVHRPDRLADIMEILRKNKLEPKRIRFVYSHTSGKENAKLVLIEAIKNAKPFLKVEPNLFVYNSDGSYTEEIYKIYNMEVN